MVYLKKKHQDLTLRTLLLKEAYLLKKLQETEQFCVKTLLAKSQYVNTIKTLRVV